MRGRPTRRRIAAVSSIGRIGRIGLISLISLIMLIMAAPIVAAPNVAATCTHVLAIVERAGESVGEPEREACAQRFDAIRRDRGVLGWTWLAWCTRYADSIEEAGRC